MSFLPEPVSVEFDDLTMRVALEDGRMLAVPLSRYPALHGATPDQRSNFWLSPGGIHWDDLDEDISVEGMLAVGTAMAAPRHAA